MKTTASQFLGPDWSVQEGINPESLIISRWDTKLFPYICYHIYIYKSEYGKI
jgi:hypothetical protein